MPVPASDEPVVGRLAPSPTGLLHLGHARTFLLAWWSARARGGRIVLRIDDLDGERATREFADAACRDLEWLGLDWDGAPYFESSGLARMQQAIDELLAAGRAFVCTCSRGDVRNAQSAPHEGASRNALSGHLPRALAVACGGRAHERPARRCAFVGGRRGRAFRRPGRGPAEFRGGSRGRRFLDRSARRRAGLPARGRD